MILSWLIFVPLIGSAVALSTGRRPTISRAVAFCACGVDFGLAVALWDSALRAGPGSELMVAWIPLLGISYHLVVDGFSLLLILLTTFLGMVAVAASWREITERVGSFHCALLLSVMGVVGVFLMRDLFFFYFFWELMLIPMYFLIGMWGYERRLYATIKFFLFTFIGSMLMLASILGLALIHLRETGILTFDSQLLLGTPLAPPTAALLMTGFLAAFLVKIPAIPLHVWQPDAYMESSTGTTILLAGALAKTGAYGLIRFAVPLFPSASSDFAIAGAVAGVVGILYGGLLAVGQTDMKRFIAYTSISHMGFVLLGIYAGTEIALEGVVVQLLAHGLATPALFLISGAIRERCRTVDLDRLDGGLWEPAPRLGGFTMFFALAALGLPGMGNFVGEFLILLGTYPYSPALAAVGTGGFIVSVIYAVVLVQRTVHGPNREPWKIPDLSAREIAALAFMSAGILWLGLYPQPMFEAGREGVLPAQRYFAGAIPDTGMRATYLDWRPGR